VLELKLTRSSITGRTDGQNPLAIVQRSAFRAMRTRCKNDSYMLRGHVATANMCRHWRV